MNKNKKRLLHTISKVLLGALIGFVVFNVIVISGIAIYNKSQLKKEAQYLQEPGRLYSINGHSMHIYETGNLEAEHTLLFMHGTMGADSVVSLRPLFDELREDYHLVYIDRAGNGYSDVTAVSRDVDTMLSETRALLAAAEIEGPFVLVPYYSAGMEALYWYQTYPEEVHSIVGIDMTYPAKYQAYQDNWDISGVSKMFNMFCKIGGQRLITIAYPTNEFGLYTEKEMLTRNALISKYGYTDNMYNEDCMIYENAKSVGLEYFPTELPMLQLVSNKAMEPYLSTDEELQEQIENAKETNPDLDPVKMYNEGIVAYFAQFDNVDCVELAGPTELYEYCPEKVAEEIVRFLGK